MDPLEEYMVDDWSRTWLADPRCQNWFSARIDTDPLGEGESLADYVRDRAEELVALPVDAAMIKGAVDGTGEREDYSKYQDLFDIDPSTGTDAFASDFYSYSPSTSQLPDHSFQPRSTESLFVQNPLAQPNMFALFNQRLPDLPTAVNPGLLFPNGSLDPTQISQNSNQASSVAGPSRSRSLAPVTAADGIPSSSLSSLDPTPTSTSNGKTPRSRATSAGNGESKVSALETQWNEAHAQWEQSLSLLNQKNALSPKRFAAAPSATYNAIANLLDTFSITSTGANKRLSRWGDSSDVPPSGRLSILTSMLANARGEFWLAWLEPEKSKNPSKGMEILEKWLLSAVSTKATTAGSTENQLASTVFPILKVLDNLPLKFEHLAATKLGKAVKRLGNPHSSNEIQQLAASLVTKWLDLTKQEQSVAGVGNDLKRKVDAAPIGSKVAVKKAKVAPTAATKAKAPPTGFGGTQDKPKLPSFKKNVAVDGYKEAMSKLKKVEPVVVAPADPPIESRVTALSTGKAKSTKKKSVRFNDVEIATFRFIEGRELGGNDGGHEAMSADEARDMEGQEGATLTELQNYMDEEVPWYEPTLIEFPAGDEFESFLKPPQESTEIAEQTSREKNAMAVEYSSRDDIPFSPSEPSSFPRDDSVPKTIPLSTELANDAAVQSDIAVAQAQSVPMGGFASDLVLSNLLGSLQPTGSGLDPNTLNALRGYDPAAIQALLDRDPSLSGHAVDLQNAGVLANPANRHQHPDRQRNQNSGWDTPSSTPWGGSSREFTPSTSSRRGRGGTLSGRNGRKINTVCKFFSGPTGCSREGDCAFIHQG